MTYQLGIDLGTTYTAAAVCRSTDRARVDPEIVTLGTRTATVASVMYVDQNGSVLVGESAERRALTDPDRVVREFKRRIGDETPIIVGGRAYQAHELAARMVRWVADRVAEREGGPAKRIAVTHPASWGPHKKELLGRALQAGGLNVTFLAEPQAAALSYASAERVEPGSTIAVYDLGGGTFDAAVVRKNGTFTLLGQPEGIEHLGGVDFDEVVFNHVRDGLDGAMDSLDPADPNVLAAVSRLRRECVEAKEALSSDTEVTIPVLLPELRTQSRLVRSEFEAMIRPALDDTVVALRRAVTSAGLTPADLTAVLLVGGSSRIPLVSQLVSNELGRPVAVDADPKNAIALGAALSISPQPTASWPAVAVPPIAPPAGPRASTAGVRPLAAAAGAATAAAVGAAGVAGLRASSPPPRPPVQGSPQGPPPGAGPMPTRVSSTRGLPASQQRQMPQQQGPQPPRPPVQYVSAGEREPDSQRPVGLLIGVGGLLAVAVIVGAVFLWPDSSPASPAGNTSTVQTTEDTPQDTTTAETTTTAPTPNNGGGRVTPRTTTPTRTTTTTTTPPTSSTKVSAPPPSSA